MAVQLPISYETLLTLVEQLPAEQQQDLLHRLQTKQPPHQKLSKEEWIALFESLKIDTPIGEGFTLNREDWYDDEEL